MTHRPTNEQIVSALKRALDYLSPTRYDAGGKYEYICWALSYSERSKEDRQVTQWIQCEVIYPRLSEHPTLTCWLIQECKIPKDDVLYDDGRNAQIHRRAWVNMLIEEFSA